MKLSKDDLVTSLDAAPAPPPPLINKHWPTVKRFGRYREKSIKPRKHAQDTSRENHYLAAYCRRGNGGAYELAIQLGVDRSLISLWVRGKRKIPVRRCYQIEELTKGQLTCEMLRPDFTWKRKHYNQTIIHEGHQ